MTVTLKQYLGALPETRRERMSLLHQRVLSLATDITVSMRYRMPTYQRTEGLDEHWLAIGNQKHYVSVYTCGPHHLATVRKKHPTGKGGKGCLNFREGDELPMRDLDGVFRSALGL